MLYDKITRKTADYYCCCDINDCIIDLAMRICLLLLVLALLFAVYIFVQHTTNYSTTTTIIIIIFSSFIIMMWWEDRHGRIALVHQHFCSDTCRESYATLSLSKYADSSMNESVKKALSIVTRSNLRFVSLVNCNVQCERVSTAAQAEHDEHPVAAELSKLYYFCLGKNGLCESSCLTSMWWYGY